MPFVFELNRVTKRFGTATALADVSLSIPEQHVVGLIGLNGSGKTTLLHHLVGLLLPTEGSCTTLRMEAASLGPEQLRRIGIVYQENRFLDWMTVQQHLSYVGSFYRLWDNDRQRRLLDLLELDLSARVGTLSPGDVQKLGLILAVCHHPELLLLDEPVSALDPIARHRLLEFFLDLLQEDHCTIVISSHILRDIEQVVDWIVCLDAGRIAVDTGLDDLQERFSEWIVTSSNGGLPSQFDEGFVCEQHGSSAQAHLLVRDATGHLDTFRRKHGAEVSTSPLNLERIFPLLLKGGQ